MRALMFDAVIPSSIDASVKDGMVTLTGRCTTLAAMREGIGADRIVADTRRTAHKPAVWPAQPGDLPPGSRRQ